MNRSRIDIIIDILEVAVGGTNKTKIVYRTNLNFKLAGKYLSLLQDRGLIENRLDKYITTEKGKIILGKAKELISQLAFPIVSSESFHNLNPIEKPKKELLKIPGGCPSF
ncbi:MAG TPA: winged helix-turn-helix domain-containing protein [Candidatus Methanoperedens sp.]